MKSKKISNIKSSSVASNSLTKKSQNNRVGLFLNNIKKGQIFSADVAIGLMIFIAAFAIFMGLFIMNQEPITSSVAREGNVISNQITGRGTLAVVDEEDAIDPDAVRDLQEMDYQEVRSQLGLNTRFCVFFMDDEGNLIQELGSAGDPNVTYTVKKDSGDVEMSCDMRVMS